MHTRGVIQSTLKTCEERQYSVRRAQQETGRLPRPGIAAAGCRSTGTGLRKPPGMYGDTRLLED